MPSKPALTRMKSGLNRRAAGTSFCSNAARICASLAPGGSGTLSVVPTPLPAPVSAALPVPGYAP